MHLGLDLLLPERGLAWRGVPVGSLGPQHDLAIPPLGI